MLILFDYKNESKLKWTNKKIKKKKKKTIYKYKFLIKNKFLIFKF